jgi:hypothetical protein
MTNAAREVLDDCRGAINSLIDGLQGREWRRCWILSVVLLRTIGHVLNKVDGAQSQAHRAAIDRWWEDLNSRKPEPAIFRAFIEEERKLILKEYQTKGGKMLALR